MKVTENKIKKEQFEPGPLGVFVNPFYIARKGLLKAIMQYGNYITGKTLDIGCGTKPYEKYFAASSYYGLEIADSVHDNRDDADVFYDGTIFPFSDGMFDSAVTNQVLEHVFTPETFLGEIHRILKPGGKVLLTVPFVWDEHEQPYDYARYSSFGLKHLFDKQGFDVLEHTKSVNNWGVISQLTNAYLYKITAPIPLLRKAATVLLMAPITLSGLLLGMLLPKNNDLYLDNIIVAQKRTVSK